MTEYQIVTGPGATLPGPLAAAVTVALAVIAAGVPLGAFRTAGIRWALDRIRTDRRDRQLRHLIATNDDMRDPNYCYTHGRICAPCPTPPPEPRR